MQKTVKCCVRLTIEQKGIDNNIKKQPRQQKKINPATNTDGAMFNSLVMVFA